MRRLALAIAVAAALLAPGAARADAFRDFLDGLRPEAAALGVYAATFDAETRDLAPDLSLPDLVLPGRPARGDGQAEFSLTPAQYLAETAIAGAASRGRALAARHRETLEAVERRFGVPGSIVLAIWARETGYGVAGLKYDAIRVLATQAWLGRRKTDYRRELLMALKMLQDGEATRATMKSSWAGALGQTQSLPSRFHAHAVDMDGDGRRDIWNSVPDVLGTIANHLAAEGWVRARPWAREVKVPQGLDCTSADPDRRRPLADWRALGVSPVAGGSDARGEDVALLLPAGLHGPGFLIGTNYFALKGYNFSDLYVLYVGHLADRIDGGGRFATLWGAVQQPSASSLAALQGGLAAAGHYDDTIDGKAGMKTRLAIGRYQKTKGLAVDCWPNAATLASIAGTR